MLGTRPAALTTIGADQPGTVRTSGESRPGARPLGGDWPQPNGPLTGAEPVLAPFRAATMMRLRPAFFAAQRAPSAIPNAIHRDSGQGLCGRGPKR